MALKVGMATLRVWISGKWVAIVYLAIMSPDIETGFLMRCKIPVPVIALVVSIIIQSIQGLRRQPSRRHGRRESLSTELRGNRQEPQQP